MTYSYLEKKDEQINLRLGKEILSWLKIKEKDTQTSISSFVYLFIINALDRVKSEADYFPNINEIELFFYEKSRRGDFKTNKFDSKLTVYMPVSKYNEIISLLDKDERHNGNKSEFIRHLINFYYCIDSFYQIFPQQDNSLSNGIKPIHLSMFYKLNCNSIF